MMPQYPEPRVEVERSSQRRASNCLMVSIWNNGRQASSIVAESEADLIIIRDAITKFIDGGCHRKVKSRIVGYDL